MLNEAQLVAQAEAAAGEPVLVHTEARRQRPGEILSQRGLLAATRSALVFVVDELLRPGEAKVFRTADLTGHTHALSSFAATLTLETADGRTEFSDLGRDKLTPLLVQCGLQDKPDTASETETTTPALPDSLSVPFVVDFASPTFAPPTFAPEPVVSQPDRLFAADFGPPKTPDTDSDSGTEHRIGDQVDKRNIDEKEDPAEEEDDEDEDDADDEDEDDEDADEDDEGDDNEDENDDDDSGAKDAAIDHSEHKKSEPPPVIESKETETPKPAASQTPEAVSTSIGLWILLLLIVGIGLAYWIPEQRTQHHFGITPQSVLSLMKDWRDVMSTGYVLAALVVLIGAPANALGCRPPVFFPALAAFLLLNAGLFGMEAVLPDPKHLGDTIPSAAEILERLQLANVAPLLSCVILCYLFAVPQLGLWARALATSPQHRSSSFSQTEVRAGNATPALAMGVAAIGSALFGCLYFQRASHSVAVIAISLFLISPSAILAWQGSRLDPKVKWEIGGSPAALAVQGALVYFTYWLAVRQIGIVDELGLSGQSPLKIRALLGSLDSLESTLIAVDKPLFSALVVAQLGIIAASMIGHDAIVTIEPGQKRSFLGWMLALSVVLFFAAMANGLYPGLREQYASLFALLRNLAVGHTPG